MVAVDFHVSNQELVVGGADGLENLNQQGDDVSDDLLVVSLGEPPAMQFPTVLVVL
jgi:hypothetical protein